MVKEQIVIIFNENKKRYGYRRITKELHNNDICVNHKTVRKLMKQLGLVCQVRAKRKYSSYKGEVGEVAPNLLERHFKTNQPNRKWVTDVTEFKVNDQKLYLSPILDLFNGEVVSYNLSRHPNFKQITDMLEGAFQKLPDKVDNLILHSDQGWQYQMKSYQNLLKAKGITQSMSRKATCLDNAVAENFFGLLKTELFYLEKFDSIDQLEKAIIDYIDYYNNRRIKLKLNGLKSCAIQNSDRWSRLIRFFGLTFRGFLYLVLKAESLFLVCYSIVPSPPIRAVISRIVRLFLTVSQKPLHEGPERVDECFIRKLCLMFQFPDTEMMEKFSKKLQIVQEKFLVVRFIRWYHYNDLRR